MPVVSQAYFARSHGVSRKTVTTWKARGYVVMADGGVDVDASNARLQTYRRHALPKAAEGNAQPPDTLPDETPAQAAERIALSVAPYDVNEARRIKENYLALLHQLEYDRASGAVVAVRDVAAEVGVALARVRTRLLAIPAEQAPKLHRQSTVAEVQDVLLQQITRALQELVSGVPSDG